MEIAYDYIATGPFCWGWGHSIDEAVNKMKSIYPEHGSPYRAKTTKEGKKIKHPVYVVHRIDSRSNWSICDFTGSIIHEPKFKVEEILRHNM